MPANFINSNRANADIRNVVLHSLAEFGEHQTDIYMKGLAETFDLLAQKSSIGIVFKHDRTGKTYRRFRYLSHMIYYRERKSDILIVRVLHTKMLPQKHL